MSLGELKELLRGAGFKREEGAWVIPTSDGRSQKILAEEAEPGLIHLTTTVARGAAARRAGVSHLECWERNRLSELVGLKMGSRGEVIAEAWVPTAGLDAETLELYVTHLAISADRFELLVAGEDEH